MTPKHIEICGTLIIHEKAVAKAKKNMPTEILLKNIGSFFKVLGDPTRLKIINALFHAEMCVCDLAAVLGMNLSAISHQLKTLKEANLVSYRKEGKIVYYSLTDEHVKQIYEQGFLHVKERKESDG